jgi:hypothetical protein
MFCIEMNRLRIMQYEKSLGNKKSKLFKSINARYIFLSYFVFSNTILEKLFIHFDFLGQNYSSLIKIQK